MASVLINADDFGLTDGVCRSIAALFECSGISNTSVMICVERAAERIRSHLPVDVRRFVGVHLQITPENHHGTPLSHAREIPTLVDGSGRFKPLGHTDWVNPAEVELEWEQQILATADALGGSPSHLDSHHGVHRIPSLTPIYLNLARKYGLAARGGKTPKQIDGAPYGVHTSDICTSDWTGQNGTVETFQQMVREKLPLAESGILEICTHPGFCDEELIVSSSWNTVREKDYEALRLLAEQRWFESQGISIARFQGS